MSWNHVVKAHDERRDIAIPGDSQTTIDFCVNHFIAIAQESINDHGYFAVALSGGSTPKIVYEQLALPANAAKIDWTKVLLFWSDERAVAPTSSDSNYHMAMEAGFSALPIPAKNIFRMQAEEEIEAHALEYETLIREKIPGKVFDLTLLGVGDDGHTASLFPHTHGLHAEGRLVIANFLPEKKIWRMSLTFDCINASKHICVYALGKGKATILAKVLSGKYLPDDLPSQRVGTATHKALWIMDEAAAEQVQ